MNKAGGIICLIAGIFSVFAAGATLFLGGLGAALEAEGGETVIMLGWVGLLMSFVIIILGAIAIGKASKLLGGIIVLSSIVGAVVGGTFVAIFMVLSLLGGVLVLFSKKKPAIQQAA